MAIELLFVAVLRMGLQSVLSSIEAMSQLLVVFHCWKNSPNSMVPSMSLELDSFVSYTNAAAAVQLRYFAVVASGQCHWNNSRQFQ